MKNQTILSLLTAGAIVATSAASFAAWDKTTETASNKLNIAKPVTIQNISMDEFKTNDSRTLDGSAPVYESDVVFEVTDDNSLVDTLTLSAAIKNGDTDVSDKFTISYYEGATKLTNGKDETITKGSASKNTYTVKITPLDDAKALAGTDLNVEVTGTVSKTAI